MATETASATKKHEGINSILVIEDNPLHIAAAIRQLREDRGYKLSIIANFDDFVRYILNIELERPGAYHYNIFGYPTPRKVDVVLSDLHFPISEGEEPSPLGYHAAFLSAQALIPHIAIVTDTNHHHGPLAKTLDILSYKGFDEAMYSPHFDLASSEFHIFDADHLGMNSGCEKKWDLALDYMVEGGKRWVRKIDQIRKSLSYQQAGRSTMNKKGRNLRLGTIEPFRDSSAQKYLICEEPGGTLSFHAWNLVDSERPTHNTKAHELGIDDKVLFGGRAYIYEDKVIIGNIGNSCSPYPPASYQFIANHKEELLGFYQSIQPNLSKICNSCYPSVCKGINEEQAIATVKKQLGRKNDRRS